MNSSPGQHARPFPPRWLVIILGCIVVVGVILTVGLQLKAQLDTRTAQANSQTLAADIKRMCATNGTLMVDDRDLCVKATQVQENPTQAIPGPKGDTGADGLDGLPGIDGATGPPGPTGPAGQVGPAGADGTDGISGESGLPGAGGLPGPAGPAGKDGAMGATGATGLTGESGRGITGVQCIGDGDDSYWQITYTDGTTAQSSGPCRIEGPEPTALPTP